MFSQSRFIKRPVHAVFVAVDISKVNQKKWKRSRVFACTRRCVFASHKYWWLSALWSSAAELQRRIQLTSHGNEVLSQDTTHLIQRLCYQRGSPCQDPAGNWTTWRPDDRKETQTTMVWSCFPFIRSGQNHLARHSERGKKTRQTEEEVGRQHQGMDRPGVWQVPEGSGEQEKIEKTGCKIICGAPATLAVKELMMMMMMKYWCSILYCWQIPVERNP